MHQWSIQPWSPPSLDAVDDPPPTDSQFAASDLALSLRDLFSIFLKTGVTFGTGTGTTFMPLGELVEKRQAMSRAEFMSLYRLARIIPTGSFTALAVAVGYRNQRFPGTLVAQLATMVPAFLLLVGLTVAYTALVGNPTFDLVTRTLMPAALALLLFSRLPAIASLLIATLLGVALVLGIPGMG